jgi:hypothetical protein
MELPTLGPIPTTPFDIDGLQAPTEPRRQLDVHIDLEGSGGRTNTLNGVCAIGMLGVDSETRKEIFAYEVAVEPLVRDDEFQIKDYWEKPAHKSAWERIVAARRPRLEVAEEILAMVKRLRELGWEIMLFARPAAYDFRELTGFFQTLGVQRVSDTLEGLAADGNFDRIRAQAVTGFPLAEAVIENPRGTMASPFGFGGASQVTCVGQVFLGIAWALGVEPTGFNDVMRRVIGRAALTHGGLQDARDQAATWYAVKDSRGNPDRLRELLSK